MDDHFAALCERLETKVALQYAQLEMCVAQHQAIRENDFEYLEAKASDIVAVAEKGRAVEEEIRALSRTLAQACGLDEGPVTIRHLVQVAPPKYQARLRTCDDELKQVQKELRELALAGIGSLQRSAAAIFECVRGLKSCVELAPQPLLVRTVSGQPSAETCQDRFKNRFEQSAVLS